MCPLFFPSIPAGLTLTIRLVDPSTLPPISGVRVGDLSFSLDAHDGTGATLTALPAEVHLRAAYTERDASGLNEQTITLSWLDPADNQWKPAPKLATDPANNLVDASITSLGSYVVTAN